MLRLMAGFLLGLSASELAYGHWRNAAAVVLFVLGAWTVIGSR